MANDPDTYTCNTCGKHGLEEQGMHEIEEYYECEACYQEDVSNV